MSPGLAAGFAAAVERTPDATALRLGTRSWSFAELHEKALRWAGHLPNTAPVGVLGRGETPYVGVLAALYAGATVVPLNPAFPADRTRRMLSAAGVQTVITGEPVAPGPHRLTAPLPVTPDDTAYILFTSGSTGRPKGVPISHGNLAHYFRCVHRRYGFGPDDVVAQTFDLTFDLAMFELFAAWDAGAAVVGVPPAAYRDLPSFVTRHELTVWLSTPSTIALARRFGGLPPRSMESLRWSLFCGEALLTADALQWQAAAPRSTVENLYGPTELTISCTAHRWSATSPNHAVNGVVPIGVLHDGLDHLIVDTDGNPSATGELCVTGPQMFRGYLDPNDDEGRFLIHASRRWYRTGDRVGHTTTGELTFLGRVDDQIQVRGWRVEPAELEHRLRDAAGVPEAVVVAPVVAGTRVLVAFHTGAPHPPAALNSLLAQTIPPAMLPDHYVHVTELPRNGNNKIDRARLEAHAAERVRQG